MWNLEDLEPQERRELEDEFRSAANLKAVQAEIAQRRAANLHQAMKPRSLSFGHQVAAVDPLFFHFWRSQGRSFGDKDWLKWILNRHESLRVTSGPSKIYSAWTPGTEHSRFHRRYAEAAAA